MKASSSDSDDFLWQVCFDGDAPQSSAPWSQDGDSRSEEGIEAYNDSSSGNIYRLPTTTVGLKLQPLPAKDGVWSPVGADAWYSSALLSTILLTEEGQSLSLHKIIDDNHSNNQMKDFMVLELGSGAVGLSGFACAIAVGRKNSSSKVFLTDNDPDVLKQLEKNIHNCQDLMPSNVCLEATHLDWGDFAASDVPQGIDLVIGSELVYTDDTGTACANLLLELLANNDSIKIIIVQVVDRYGWKEILIPKLEAIGASIQPIDLSAETHATAMKMIPRGGTLDPYSYGGFMIQNKII